MSFHGTFRHYNGVESSDNSILLAWGNIKIDFLGSLMRSISSRCIAVLGKWGAKTKY